MDKADGAFLTIGELARELGVAQHILRYWESRFPQLRPLQRSGNRRYYRPRDVEMAREINRLLNVDGFTVRGAQRALADARKARHAAAATEPAAATPVLVDDIASARSPAVAPAERNGQAELPMDPPPARVDRVGPSDLSVLIARLTAIRQDLKDALDS